MSLGQGGRWPGKRLSGFAGVRQARGSLAPRIANRTSHFFGFPPAPACRRPPVPGYSFLSTREIFLGQDFSSNQHESYDEETIVFVLESHAIPEVIRQGWCNGPVGRSPEQAWQPMFGRHESAFHGCVYQTFWGSASPGLAKFKAWRNQTVRGAPLLCEGCQRGQEQALAGQRGQPVSASSCRSGFTFDHDGWMPGKATELPDAKSR